MPFGPRHTACMQNKIEHNNLELHPHCQHDTAMLEHFVPCHAIFVSYDDEMDDNKKEIIKFMKDHFFGTPKTHLVAKTYFSSADCGSR